MHPFFKALGNYLVYIIMTIVFISAGIGMF
jgi:hypothetical protein